MRGEEGGMEGGREGRVDALGSSEFGNWLLYGIRVCACEIHVCVH